MDALGRATNAISKAENLYLQRNSSLLIIVMNRSDYDSYLLEPKASDCCNG